MELFRKEIVMAESMESIVTGVILLAVAAILVAAHYRRERRRERWLTRLDGHRLWDRLRHRP
ncbi:MAG: hypothetical protein QOI13_2839 [Paraburkholderia sp.]|jgi:hypothetical protein|nr:hypothetical protein [Paraburkholderia sp.]